MHVYYRYTAPPCPYILLSIFPSMLSLLPKPGTWMETFKQFMAFPMILTALWLVWVLSSQIDAFQLVLVLVGISLIVFFYWLNQINTGLEDKSELLMGFSESTENKQIFSNETNFF